MILRLNQFIFNTIIKRSHFPIVQDAAQEQAKLNVLRIATGLIVMTRLLLNTYATYYYFEPVTWFAGISLPPQFLVSLGLLLLVFLFTIGWMTPLVTFLLLLTYNGVDQYLGTGTLGSNVLTSMLLLFFLVNAGARYSVDAYLLGKGNPWIARLYALLGFPSRRQLTVYYFLAFCAYGVLSLGALTFHLKDPYWFQGLTVGVMLTNSYLSRFYEVFRALEYNAPQAYLVFSKVSVLLQSIFQGLMLPMMFTRIGKWFVVGWGAAFFIISILCLQLSYLPYLEIVLWLMLFAPSTAQDRIQILYDDQCNLCANAMRLVRWLNVIRVADFLPLSKNLETAAQYGIQPDDLYQNMHGLYQNRVFVGYDLYLLLARRNPLLWVVYPVLLLGKLTGIGPKIYGWVAQNRYRVSKACGLKPYALPARPAWKPLQYQRYGIITGVIVGFMLSTSLVYFETPLAKPAVKKTVQWYKPILLHTGLVPPNVFNHQDLSLGDKWVTVTRHYKDQPSQRVPFADAKGARLQYHLFDTLYFGNSLKWRRKAIRFDPVAFNQPEGLGYQYLLQLLYFDYQLHQAQAPTRYHIDVFASRATDVAIKDLDERYRAFKVYEFDFPVSAFETMEISQLKARK